MTLEYYDRDGSLSKVINFTLRNKKLKFRDEFLNHDFLMIRLYILFEKLKYDFWYPNMKFCELVLVKKVFYTKILPRKCPITLI